jgi:hypothetical protein
MGRPELKVDAPAWFDGVRYDDAHKMDEGDWYVNLALRGEIARGVNKQHALLVAVVRGKEPLIRRADLNVELRFALPQPIVALLDGRDTGSGVAYLRAEALYYFEKRLPKQIREFGANPRGTGAPEGFTGPIDHLFKPRYLSVFARINLALPDEVLLQDMRDFLRCARGEFRAIGGPQPYAQALRELRGRKSAKLKTFVKIKLLPLMDIEQWQRDENISIRPAALARMLDTAPEDVREARKYASILCNEFVLDGWLIRAAREAVRKS